MSSWLRGCSGTLLLGCLLLLLSSSTTHADWIQSTCTDSACSENCITKSFIEGACYPTESAGTSAKVWCIDDGSVIKTQIYSESTSCTGFSYVNKISVDVCNEGENGYYFEDTCVSSSSSSAAAAVTVDGEPKKRIAMRFVLRPAAGTIGNMTREQKHVMDIGQIEVDFTHHKNKIMVRNFPFPPYAFDKHGRVKVSRIAVKSRASSRRHEKSEQARNSGTRHPPGFGEARLSRGIVSVAPTHGARSMIIYKDRLLEHLNEVGWDQRRGAEIVFMDRDRRELFSAWVRAL